MKASQSEGMPKGSSDGLAVTELSPAHSPGNDSCLPSIALKSALLIFYFLQEGNAHSFFHALYQEKFSSL
jgi:hypothetical protein